MIGHAGGLTIVKLKFILRLDLVHEIREMKGCGVDFRRGIGNHCNSILLSQH